MAEDPRWATAAPPPGGGMADGACDPGSGIIEAAPGGGTARVVAVPGRATAEEEFAFAPGRGIPFEVDMLHRRQSESGDAKIRPILGEIDAPAERRQHIDH